MLSALGRTLRFVAREPLNVDRPVGSMLGVLRWQLGSRLLGFRAVVPWVDEARMLLGRGDHALSGNLYCGLMEFAEMGLVLHALRPEHLFVDVGANLGAYSILASRVVGAESVALEPVPSTVARLREQAGLNGVGDRVRVLGVGAGARREVRSFTRDADATNRVATSRDPERTVEVEVRPLDELAELDGDRAVFLKIDVEGFEREVLRGASRLLASGRVLAMIVELNGSGAAYGHDDEEVHEAIVEHGLVPIAYDPLSRRVGRLEGPDPARNNTLYARDPEEVARLVAEAPRRVVHTARGREI